MYKKEEADEIRNDKAVLGEKKYLKARAVRNGKIS